MVQESIAQKPQEEDIFRQFRGNFNTENIIYKNILPNINETVLNDDSDIKAEYQTFERPPKDNWAKSSAKCSDETFASAENSDNMDEAWKMYLAYAQNALANLAVKNNTECVIQSHNCATAEICPQAEAAEIKTQLNRIEAMLAEIHCCNQKLYESLLDYCTNYSADKP